VRGLEDRVVAIAGAGGSLGPVVARALADAGAKLALTDVDQERLDALAADLGVGEERIDARVVDLLHERGAQEWATALRERFGGVDAVAHLVGGWRGGVPIHQAPLEDWDWLHGLLIRTVQHTSRAFFDDLARSGRGRFVLVSAAQAQKPTSTNAAYAAAKAAAEAWTLALAGELADHGGTANIVVVNAIVTPQMREQSPDKPFRTFTDAQDIADGIAFLLSDAAAKMNGQRLALHG